ncbi:MULTISPECIES: alcohol dehydrogenase catalytic domain-containing protein [unclassified Streptomyces]|uniref:alcohol dehydrogenase catalytic domain-containing protein n=1 Tax=unclassified Streptomyces TaxID=2593676 RepID=UPI000C1A8FC0
MQGDTAERAPRLGTAPTPHLRRDIRTGRGAHSTHGACTRPCPPPTYGRDVAGLACRVGPAVHGFKAGDEVYTRPRDAAPLCSWRAHQP